MTGDNDRRRAARDERKRQRLGNDDPVRTGCGQSDIRCLMGRRDGPATLPVSLCYSCRKKRRIASGRSLLRSLRRFEDAGYESPACVLCAEADLRALELHHVAGQVNSGLTVPCCANCHAMASDSQGELAGKLLRNDAARRPLARQAAFELGVAILILVLIVVTQLPSSGRIAGASIAGGLIAWAVWNLTADQHFAVRYGEDYSVLVPAEVPA